MGRFEDVDNDVIDLLHEIIQEYFPEFRNLKIKGLFDLKKRTNGGKIVLARIQKTNDLLRHLTIEESRSDEGYDVILYIDRKCWENVGREDKVRILRHEIRHLAFNEKGEVVVIPHDIEDFVEEVQLNQNDMRWRDRVATITSDIYEQERELTENTRQRRR